MTAFDWSLALIEAGINIETSKAVIAMITNTSITVKAAGL
jgi:hypothetical protein